MTRNTVWESDKTHKKTQHTREPRGQPFPVGEQKAASNRQDSITNMKHKEDLFIKMKTFQVCDASIDEQVNFNNGTTAIEITATVGR